MRRVYRIALALAALLLAAAFAVSGTTPKARLVLYNNSASMPEGFWRRTQLAPETGRVIAFTVPSLGRAYAATRTRDVDRYAILKRVAAAQGDMVCNRGGVFRVNGHLLGVARARDSTGIALPQWRGCRPLRAGEYFVFSNRIPNSFDSRYFGPVPQSHILAVYEPLWIHA